MLFDRCILTRKNDEWFGLVEVCQRVGERWRFAAWIMLIILIFELFRLSQAGFWYFNWVEGVVLLLSAFLAIAFFRRSAKTYRHREIVFRLPPPKPILDPVGQTIGFSQSIALPENGGFKNYNLDRFTHVVFGLIDYPWPGRKNVFVDAYALYLAEADGTPHAIVEGCFDKHTCFALARRLSAMTKIPFIELGKGHPYKASPENK